MANRKMVLPVIYLFVFTMLLSGCGAPAGPSEEAQFLMKGSPWVATSFKENNIQILKVGEDVESRVFSFTFNDLQLEFQSDNVLRVKYTWSDSDRYDIDIGFWKLDTLENTIQIWSDKEGSYNTPVFLREFQSKIYLRKLSDKKIKLLGTIDQEYDVEITLEIRK